MIVANGALVYFHAGTSISLEPGFSVEPGGVFHAIISDCVYGNAKSNNARRRTSLIPGEGLAGLKDDLKVWPTVVQGEYYTMEFSDELAERCSEVTMEAYDAFGRVVGVNHFLSVSGTQQYPQQVPKAASGVILLVLRDCSGNIVETERIIVP